MNQVGMPVPEPQRRKILVINTGGRVGMKANPEFEKGATSAIGRSGFKISAEGKIRIEEVSSSLVPIEANDETIISGGTNFTSSANNNSLVSVTRRGESERGGSRAFAPDHLSPDQMANEREKRKVCESSRSHKEIPDNDDDGKKVPTARYGNRNSLFIAKPGFLGDQMKQMSEFKSKAMPNFEVRDLNSVMDEDGGVRHSAEISPDDWVHLAEMIQDNYKLFDGFVVVHGTDTMHYSATALSFMLQHLGKPVVFTGAMLPLDEAYNDARRNLSSAMMFAAHLDICEVCVYFNEALLRGNRSVMVSQTLTALESPNFPPLAVFRHDGFVLNSGLLLKQPRQDMTVQKYLSTRVLCVVYTCELDADALCDSLFSKKRQIVNAVGAKPAESAQRRYLSGVGDHPIVAAAGTASSNTFPGESKSQASASEKEKDEGNYISPSDSGRLCDALVVEVSGIGSIDTKSSHLAETLRTLAQRAEENDAIVALTSPSVVHGTPEKQQEKYLELSSSLVQCDDMTTEAAVVKAMYLCGVRNKQKKDRDLHSAKQASVQELTTRGDLQNSSHNEEECSPKPKEPWSLVDLRRLMLTPLRGEISANARADFYDSKRRCGGRAESKL